MNLLEDIRKTVAKFLTYALWGHVAIVLLIWLTVAPDDGLGMIWAMAIAVILAVVPMIVLMTQGETPFQRYLTCASLALMAALFVLGYQGHAWQIDVHMYFFAVLAVVSLYCDWRAIFVTAAVIAVHHLVFGLVWTSLVFPTDEGAFLRVMLHAVIVVLESAALIFGAMKLRETFLKVDEAEGHVAEEVEHARREAEAAATAKAEAEEALAAAHKAQEEMKELEKQGDLERQQAAVQAKAVRAKMANDFEQNMSGLLSEIAEVSHQLEEETELLSRVASDTESAMAVANGATDNVANNVNAVASSAEEMSSSVSEISRQVNMSAGVTDEARRLAKNSEERIKELADRADKINDVLGMIGDIAEQTNLLALNATIEAARAGEAGRGFAVVASEVKSLANQSAKATEEIGSLLAGIRDATGEAVNVNRQIVTVIGQISENSTSIASAVEEQSAATEEIARAAQHAAADTIEAKTSVGNMDAIAIQISKAAEMTAGAVSSLGDKTAALSAKAEEFTATMRG